MTTDLKHPDHLLPFYVNGSLNAEQIAEIEQHMQDCDRCQNEVRFLHKLRKQVKDISASQAPGEFGLQRLLRDIRREKPVKKTNTWWKPALAAAMLVIVVQAGMLLQRDESGDRYQQLGGPEQGIQVMFQPTATEKQIRELLGTIDAHIIDGPSALGVYRIQLTDSTDTDKDKQRRAALLEQLRTHNDIVREVLP